MEDPYNLTRFVIAQTPLYTDVCNELRMGQKKTHWMWFIFPQIIGLGASETALFFSISCPDEARDYLNHSILGPRLIECTQLVNSVTGRSARKIFKTPDDLKFRSSMTLFACVTPGKSAFREAIDKYFGAEPDKATLKICSVIY